MDLLRQMRIYIFLACGSMCEYGCYTGRLEESSVFGCVKIMTDCYSRSGHCCIFCCAFQGDILKAEHSSNKHNQVTEILWCFGDTYFNL